MPAIADISLKTFTQSQKLRFKSHAQIKAEAIQRAKQWQDLIGTHGIEKS